MKHKLLEEYALINAQIKNLNNRKDELQQMIIEQLISDGIEKVETGVGKFTISKLKTWEYPGYVINANEEYKALKAKAESTGEATFVESESLRFTPIKL
jgi:hypothetical protein